MSTFTDDFERADGSLGSEWTTVSGTPAITGGNVAYSSSWAAYATNYSENGRQEASCHVYYGTSAAGGSGPFVKNDGGPNNGFMLVLSYSAPNSTVSIKSGIAFTSTVIASTTLSGVLPPYNHLRIVWENGHVSGYVNGTLQVEVDSSLNPGGTYSGMGGRYTAAPIADFGLVHGAAVGLSASPNVVGNYGSCTDITLTGTNTAWTSGTPGTPAFTVDFGSISAQEVTSPTSATITYCPGNFLGTATITDPSTGATASITVTSDPGVVSPIGTLSAAALAYLERSAIAEEDAYILNRTTDITVTSEETSAMFGMYSTKRSVTEGDYAPGGDPAASALIYTLWRLVNGQYSPPAGPYPEPNFTSLDAGLGLVKGDLDALMGESEWTLPDVLAYLGGDPFGSHRDILTAIGALDFDDTAILDAIAAAQGDPLATIKAAIDLIYELQTVNGYTLSSVKTWVESVQGSGLPTVKDVADRLALIQPTTTNSIDDILTKTVGQTTLQSIVDLAVLALAGTEGATIAAVLDGIGDLAELLGGLTVSVKAPPVWPGIDGVTLGTPVALASQLTIEEPMDGCIVDVTGVDGGVAFYTYGGVKAYRNVGALCFLTDQGDLEDWQLLGREHAIYTPKSMIQAGGLKLFTGHGLVGTVTPWTVNTE